MFPSSEISNELWLYLSGQSCEVYIVSYAGYALVLHTVSVSGCIQPNLGLFLSHTRPETFLYQTFPLFSDRTLPCQRQMGSVSPWTESSCLIQIFNFWLWLEVRTLCGQRKVAGFKVLLGDTSYSTGLNISFFGLNSFVPFPHVTLPLCTIVLVHQFVYLYTVPAARFPEFTTPNGRTDVNQITRDIECSTRVIMRTWTWWLNLPFFRRELVFFDFLNI
jgi:hypothetical protein